VEVAFTDLLHREGLDAALAAVRAAITPRTKALYFASPNNPCGTVYSPEVLRALVALAEAQDLWVFVDEVYADYSYDGAFTSAASFGLERVVVIVSLSKSHGLAGARVGFVRATPAVLAEVGKVATHSAFHPSLHAQGLAHAAIYKEIWLEEARAHYTEARSVLVTALESARVPFLPPSGGSYVFADFGPFAPGGPGTSVQPLFERFIDAGVLVCPGAACGDAYTTYARICFTAEPVEVLRESVGRLVGALG
jgi:aspartate/methionine/tyrosine aminotransferase